MLYSSKIIYEYIFQLGTNLLLVFVYLLYQIDT